MTNLITEARELCELRRKQKHIPMTMLDKTLELCDALEKAQAEIPRWIPVTERLPQPNVYALVLTDTGSIRQGYIGHATGHWCSGGLVMVPTVTHWMPLPEPPKEAA